MYGCRPTVLLGQVEGRVIFTQNYPRDVEKTVKVSLGYRACDCE
jgi:hypothetical protein